MIKNDSRTALLKLSFFNPSFEDKFGNQIIDYLVLDSLATQGPLLSQHPHDIKEHIKNIFKLDYDDLEIVSSGKRLHAKGLINLFDIEDRDEYPSFKILPKTEQRINKNISYLGDLERGIFEEWKEELSVQYKKYPDVLKRLDEIVEHLQKFLSKILKYHGVECVYLLYPKNKKANEWLEEVKNNIIDSIDEKNEFIKNVIKVEITSFLKGDNPRRNKYISSLFHSSFIFHLIHVDGSITNLAKSITQGQKIFLDANILYYLVGFNGSNCLKSSHNLLKFAKQLNYKIFVTSKTIDEFHFSVSNRYMVQKEKKPVPRDLLKVALDNLDSESFIVSYWREFVKNKITIDEFISEKSHVKSILSNCGIEIYYKYREEIEKSSELNDEESILRSVCGSDIHPNIIEHDSFHRVLINKLRHKPRFHFYDASAWFLTNDRKLLDYSRVARKGCPSLPFCITPEQWIQINRPFISRFANEKDFEDSFYVLVTQPYIRSLVASISLDDAYEKVLNQLSRFDKMNPQLAMNIVADRHFMISIADIKDEKVVRDKIENKFIDIAQEKEKETEILESEKEQIIQKVSLLEHEKNSLSSVVANINDNNQKLSDENNDLKKDISSLNKEKKELNSTLSEFSRNIESIKKQNKLFEDSIHILNKIILWLLFSFLLIFLSIVTWSIDKIITFAWLEGHVNNFAIKLVLNIFLIPALLIIPLNKNWTVFLTVSVALLVLLVTISL